MLNIHKGALKPYNGNVKLFRLTMAYNSEFLTVSWFNLLLVEKCCCVHYSNETGISHSEYYINLDLHQIGIHFHDDIKNTNVDNQTVFLYILIVFLDDFSNNKDRKIIFNNFTHSLQLFLFIKLIKFLIYYSFVF